MKNGVDSIFATHQQRASDQLKIGKPENALY